MYSYINACFLLTFNTFEYERQSRIASIMEILIKQILFLSQIKLNFSCLIYKYFIYLKIIK